jgi:hypothetical protein
MKCDSSSGLKTIRPRHACRAVSSFRWAWAMLRTPRWSPRLSDCQLHHSDRVILDRNWPDRSGVAVLEAISNAELPSRVGASWATSDANSIAAFTTYMPDLSIPKPVDPSLQPIGLVGGC